MPRTASSKRRKPIAAVCLAIAVLTATACSSSGGNTAASPPPTTTQQAGAPTTGASTAAATSLKGSCPDPLIIQSSWFPEVDHYAEYALVGPNGKIDAKNGYYSGTVGGITVKVRAGGPFVGYQPPTSLLYLHPEIFMGVSRTDDQYVSSGRQQTVAVLAPLQYTPLGILWDPRHYHFKSISDVAGSGATVLAALKNASTDFLTTRGYVKKSQWSFGWDGSPGRVVSSGGTVAMWDYADQDTYNYLHQIPQWGKPLNYILAKDAGYKTYDSIFVVTPHTLQTRASCLKKLVPMIQKASVNYLHNPDAINAAMTNFSNALHGPTKLTKGLNDWEIKFDEQHGIIANGSDGTFGSFDLTRVTQFMSDLAPVLRLENVQPKQGITASQLVTNQFLDKSIHL